MQIYTMGLPGLLKAQLAVVFLTDEQLSQLVSRWICGSETAMFDYSILTHLKWEGFD